MMMELFSKANATPKKKMSKLPKGDHNDTFCQRDYVKYIREFIAEVVGNTNKLAQNAS
jgi:hypothetical protein